MYKLIRFWNRNKNNIIKVLAIIIFIFLIIQLINGVVKSKNKEKLDNLEKNAKNNTITTNNNTVSKGLVSEKSAVTGKELSKTELQNATNLIYDFVDYCNKQDLESAYNLLTDECKQQLYPSLEIFKQAYYNDVFNGQQRNCTIENWIGNTYKVDIKEDILALGKDTGYSKQDYMTIKKVNDENKLNINNYIGYTEINKTTTKDNVSMKIVGKDTYKDEESYRIQVTNNTSDIMQLDTTTSTKTLFLEDSNQVKYYWYNHELTDATLTVAVGQTKEITIKFYSSYVSNKEIRYIVFSNIILKNGQITEGLNFRANV